ncbi:uncharacterized protein N7459_004435 [Penicillium hispanicum]|uniref:uncharacterized protein n=1 Tax=Penicillium hispanicum TaxID=1080232 RepID=UPI0025408951|nr:uncharacterized protein N7459_004435 [Penicillium hispanicum]KAJ5584635.1 hypothetical protein N7459_004435 [Penicillium hispanicum]
MEHLHKGFLGNVLAKFRLRRSTQERETSSEEFHSVSSNSLLEAHDSGQLDFYPYAAHLVKKIPPYAAPHVSQEDLDLDEQLVEMAPIKRHSRPYTISSDDWVILTPVSSSHSPHSPHSQVLSLDDLSESQLATHFSAVLKIFAKVYAMAKLLQVLFLAYGVELDAAETGLMHWIKRAEMEVRTDSLAVLIEVVENLFYTLYARIVLEMSAIELCGLCKGPKRPLTTHEQFYLPDPHLLYRIFLTCKDFLDSPTVCEFIQQSVIAQYQEGYVRRVISKEADRNFSANDIFGYRRYALSIASDQSSEYCQKWQSLIAVFSEIPAETITVFAEKYFTLVPRIDIEEDIASCDLPFIDLKGIDPALWEKQIIQDHRLATLAKLESKSIGDERIEDPKYRLLSIVKHRKCICTSICFCARECTNDVERPCPCAERQLRIQLAKRRKGPGLYNFTTRTNTLARACFQGLASVKPDLDDDRLAQEVEHIFTVFDLEIQNERSAGPVFSWS